jgi:hypothetical protein
MKDCGMALRECYALIYKLAGGKTKKVSKACRKLGLPDPWSDEYGDDYREDMSIDGLDY